MRLDEIPNEELLAELARRLDRKFKTRSEEGQYREVRDQILADIASGKIDRYPWQDRP